MVAMYLMILTSPFYLWPTIQYAVLLLCVVKSPVCNILNSSATFSGSPKGWHIQIEHRHNPTFHISDTYKKFLTSIKLHFPLLSSHVNHFLPIPKIRIKSIRRRISAVCVMGTIHAIRIKPIT